jgi:hypothetical protein
VNRRMPERTIGTATPPDSGSIATGMSSITTGTASPSSHSGGRGGSRGGRGRGGRNNNRGRGGRGGHRAPSNTTSSARFEGREPGLKGHVYDISDSIASASTFNTTTEEIAEFIGRSNMKMSNNVKISLEKKKPVLPDKPEKPEKDSKGMTDEVDEDAYKEELKIYAKERREYNQSMKTAYSILYGGDIHHIPRQPKQHTAGEEWEAIKWTKDSSH